MNYNKKQLEDLKRAKEYRDSIKEEWQDTCYSFSSHISLEFAAAMSYNCLGLFKDAITAPNAPSNYTDKMAQASRKVEEALKALQEAGELFNAANG